MLYAHAQLLHDLTAMALPDDYAAAFSKLGFDLKGKLGSGLSGTVYRAAQRSLGRDVAIKVFDNPYSEKDPAIRKRFDREARLLARIVHPAIPVVLTRGAVATQGVERPYTVLQFIDGTSLDKILGDARRLDLPRAVSIASHVLGALGAAHSQKIIHRDVKPSNIMVHPTGAQVHLIDFSIGVSLVPGPGLTRVTGEGGRPGSFDYMAPEQKETRDVDHRADIYSLGVVLFEMLTGHPRISLSALDADLAHVPMEMRAIIRRACQPNPKDRFESAVGCQQAMLPFGTVVRGREQSGDAICVKVTCPQAQWTARGYYEGPRIVRDTKDNCCQACGSNLVYECERCGRPFEGNQFCGNCGNKLHEVPECDLCGSWLTAKDMGTDTVLNGCEKCRRTRTRAGVRGTHGTADNDPPF